MRRSFAPLTGLLIAAVIFSFTPLHSLRGNGRDPELKGSFRRPQKNGWTFVHLQGTPHQIGFQNGYLLAPEIEDTLKVVMLEETHGTKRDWSFFRDAAQNMMWPHIEPEKWKVPPGDGSAPFRERVRGAATMPSGRPRKACLSRASSAASPAS